MSPSYSRNVSFQRVRSINARQRASSHNLSPAILTLFSARPRMSRFRPKNVSSQYVRSINRQLRYFTGMAPRMSEPLPCVMEKVTQEAHRKQGSPGQAKCGREDLNLHDR